jgi:hypothetical protein
MCTGVTAVITDSYILGTGSICLSSTKSYKNVGYILILFKNITLVTKSWRIKRAGIHLVYDKSTCMV